MYRLLIVDDEPIIVEGLYLMLQEATHLSVEIYKAYSASDAMKYLEKRRIDIVLTDIEMPQFNGLMLQQQIQTHWPHCKVIILTGYNYAEYMHQSIRHGAVDYVLKTEGDEAILTAVEKAYHLLTQQVDVEQMARKARDQMAEALPLLLKDYWLELLRGEPSDFESRVHRFKRLGVPLRADQSVLLLVGRIDEWREDLEAADKALLQYCIQNVAEEFLHPKAISAHVFFDREFIVWFLQQKDAESDDVVMTFVGGQLERIQQACQSFLAIRCSFALASKWSQWEEVPDTFDRLSFVMMQGFGMEKEMILSDRMEQAEDHALHESRQQVKRLQTLSIALEKGEEVLFLSELRSVFSWDYAAQEGITLEIYHSLLALFLSYINRNRLMVEINEQFNMGKWLYGEDKGSWKSLQHSFEKLAALCFQKKRTEEQYRSDETVIHVQAYIRSNLGGDLSLTQLAEQVYLTPGYLSRLYRVNTGQNISDYIVQMRLEQAKAQLTQTQEKIHRIGKGIGFESPSYFTKFFKKHVGISPQEYRDSFIR